jgi:hypothetical protein
MNPDFEQQPEYIGLIERLRGVEAMEAPAGLVERAARQAGRPGRTDARFMWLAAAAHLIWAGVLAAGMSPLTGGLAGLAWLKAQPAVLTAAAAVLAAWIILTRRGPRRPLGPALVALIYAEIMIGNAAVMIMVSQQPGFAAPALLSALTGASLTWMMIGPQAGRTGFKPMEDTG